MRYLFTLFMIVLTLGLSAQYTFETDSCELVVKNGVTEIVRLDIPLLDYEAVSATGIKLVDAQGYRWATSVNRMAAFADPAAAVTWLDSVYLTCNIVEGGASNPGLWYKGSSGIYASYALDVDITSSGVDWSLARNNLGINSNLYDSLTTGDVNLGMMEQSLASMKDGFGNIAIGDYTLQLNKNGDTNTAVGSGALQKYTGSSAVAFGNSALANATTGYDNTGIGSQAVRDMIDGYDNTGVGQSALRDNENGINNTAIGAQAGERNLGDQNVWLGSNTGRFNINGDSTTMIGYRAGYNNTGSGSIFLGNRAGEDETGSHKLYIEPSESATPLIYGEFDNDFIQINGDFGIVSPTVPATAGAAGKAGDIAWDADYIYVCVATNTWKRIGISTW